MRDLGRLRQVKHIESLEGTVTSSTLYTICFTDDVEGAYPTLAIQEAIPATVWRMP